jgi:high affinity Mn2+ porin
VGSRTLPYVRTKRDFYKWLQGCSLITEINQRLHEVFVIFIKTSFINSLGITFAHQKRYYLKKNKRLLVMIFNKIWLLGFVLMPAMVFAAQDSVRTPGNDSIIKNRWNIHFQTTYIYQYQPAFSAPYEGQNSLKSAMDKENSITATVYLGIRLWKGAFIYINPEMAGGSGLSGAYGLAASTNGETFRVGDPAPTLYLARGYIQQTFALGSEKTYVDEQVINQLPAYVPKNYIRLYLGKLSLGDMFDNNAYANTPRTQFMNWCLMNNGAWDYAANLRGYTYSFAAVLQEGSMSYKAALATLPIVANGEDLNTNLGQEYSVNAEVDKAYTLNKLAGNVRLLGYINDGDMGNYKQAIQTHDITGNIPDLVATRQYGRTKTGFGLNADQQLTANTGVFARLGWNDGQNETWCFTEADEIVSAGVNINGAGWQRKDDNLACAIDVNGLSQNHREYLADGGLGFQLGDGKLNYGNESALELYYSCKALASGIWLTGDYQFVLNPGYNQDRGPVNVFSFRVHVEL